MLSTTYWIEQRSDVSGRTFAAEAFRSGICPAMTTWEINKPTARFHYFRQTHRLFLKRITCINICRSRHRLQSSSRALYLFVLANQSRHSTMPLPVPLSSQEKFTNASTLPIPVSETSPSSNSAVSQAAASATSATNGAAEGGSSAAQHTKSEVEKAADKLYEERMEDEYAKREGGA